MTDVDPSPRSYVSEATEAWMRKRREEAGPRPTSDNTRGRGSDALKCARQIALKINGVPAEREPTYRNLIAWQVGQDVHDRIQRALVRDFDARIEVPVSYRPDFDVSGNVDGVYDFHPETGERRSNLVTVEIKSMGSWGYKMALGNWKKKQPFAGPKAEHLTQAALYANAPQLLSDYLHMIYFNKENGDIAEWILEMDEPLLHLEGSPSPRDLANAELRRFATIFAGIDEGKIPRRSIPGAGPIEEVPAPESQDGEFLCRVCDFNSLCARLGEASCSVGDVERVLAETEAATEIGELW